MFSYYGSKSKIVQYYPEPTKDIIIEPFAGSARYALKYWNRKVILMEKFPILVSIWKWLQKCEADDILKLPDMQPGEHVDNYKFDCQEAKWLMGFMIQGGVNFPRKTVSSVGNFGRSVQRDKERISKDIYKIKHWDIRCGDYRELENINATWFVDPPYQYGGEYYRIGNKNFDYKELSEWCKNRIGQVIVCENTKSDWMNFSPLKEMQGSKNRTTEAIWYRED